MVKVGEMVEEPLVQRHADRLEGHQALPVDAGIVPAVKAFDDSWVHANHAGADAALLAGEEGLVENVEACARPLVGLLVVEGALHPRRVELHHHAIELLGLGAAERSPADESRELALAEGDALRHREAFLGELLRDRLEHLVGERGGIPELGVGLDDDRLLNRLLEGVGAAFPPSSFLRVEAEEPALETQEVRLVEEAVRLDDAELAVRERVLGRRLTFR
jgi:hypothetical protein